MDPIFTYRDYRRFLTDKYADLKRTSSVFSYRYFSKRAGFASPNFLKLVMEGQRNLSAESVHKFAQALKLTAKEERFFELLVHYNQAGDARQRQHYYQQLLDFPEYRRVRRLEREQYEYLSRWYYPVILELVTLPTFREEPHWIAAQLHGKITPGEAREGLALLEVLGLVCRDGERWVASHAALTTGEEARTLAAYTFHEEMLEQAKAAVTQQAPEAREFAAITMAINDEQLRKLKELVRDFRKLVMNYLGQDTGPPTTVYQFGAQLFALTPVEKEKT